MIKILIFMLFIHSSFAIANDSSATLGIGGLELTKSADISIESEVLYISQSRIKVDYIFKNNSDNDINTLVAFPLPKLFSDAQMKNMALSIPNTQSENFVNFSVKVNNQEVAFNIEHKALLTDEDQNVLKDITQELQQKNIPISPFSSNYQSIMNNFPASIKQDYMAKKWFDIDKYDAGRGWVEDTVANWETQTTLYWQQNFPAQSTVHISHQYQPVVGQWFIMPDESHYHQQFCVDKSTFNGIKRLFKANPNLLLASQIQYILTTANNWQGTIKKFRLIIDKEKNNNIVSVCLPEIEKINATQFSLEYENFSPQQELNILIVNEGESNLSD